LVPFAGFELAAAGTAALRFGCGITALCCVAGFQTRQSSASRCPADLEIGDTAGLETCATLRLPPSAFRVSRAFSLVEVLIVVALLSVMVLGLMAMLGQTQRAFRLGMAQTDVLESGRAATDLLARELQQVRPSYVKQTANFYAWLPPFTPLLQELPGLDTANNKQYRTNLLEDLFFLTCENQRWTAIGYRVGTPDGGVGTLYRYMAPGLFPADLPAQLARFNNTPLTNLSRVAEGVVHFRVRAFDTNGVWITSNFVSPSQGTNIFAKLSSLSSAVPGEVISYQFTSNAVPAVVEIELGFLETRTLERANSIADAATRRTYLERQAGRVHLFRQRIPIETVDVKAYQ
jgi:prepilin-type N-terminal cleavage/methylation domain-containing protein